MSNSKTITEIEKIDQGSFHNLCDDLLVEYFGYHGILPIGINSKKEKTIQGTPDSIIFHEIKEDSATVFEYSTNGNFSKKIKEDLEKVNKQLKKNSIKVNKFVFISNRKRRNFKVDKKLLTAKEYIKKTYGWDSHIIDQEALRIPLDGDFQYLRRRYLNIPCDVFWSFNQFKNYFRRFQKKRELSYMEYFIGRESEIDKIRNFTVLSKKDVLLTFGNGGVGKTRLVLESVDLMEQDNSFKNYNFIFAGEFQRIPVSEHIHELSKTKINVIIIDDTHKIENIGDFRLFLGIEEYNTKLIMTTRSQFKNSIKNNIGNLLCEELPVERLSDREICDILEMHTEKRVAKEVLEHLACSIQGNALLASACLYLITEKNEKDLKKIKRGEIISGYFESIIQELEDKIGEAQFKKYELYLGIIASLRSLPLKGEESKELRKCIRDILSLDTPKEESIIESLVSAGILENAGNTLYVYPELLGDYVVYRLFFRGSGLCDFNYYVYNPFFSLRAKQILQTLTNIKEYEA